MDLVAQASQSDSYVLCDPSPIAGSMVIVGTTCQLGGLDTSWIADLILQARSLADAHRSTLPCWNQKPPPRSNETESFSFRRLPASRSERSIAGPASGSVIDPSASPTMNNLLFPPPTSLETLKIPIPPRHLVPLRQAKPTSRRGGSRLSGVGSCPVSEAGRTRSARAEAPTWGRHGRPGAVAPGRLIYGTLGTTAVRFLDSELGRWDVHGVKASWWSVRMRSGRLAAEAFWVRDGLRAGVLTSMRGVDLRERVLASSRDRQTKGRDEGCMEKEERIRCSTSALV